MRSVFLFILSLSSSDAFSQREFTFTKDSDEYVIKLVDSVRFEFWEKCGWCPVGCDHGTGAYTLSEKELSLDFNPQIQKNEIVLISFDTATNHSDSFYIKIRVMEDSQYGFIGASVYYHQGKSLRGAATDIDGNTQLRICKSDQIDTIYVSAIGYKELAIPITPNHQSITVQPVFTGVYDFKISGIIKFKILRGKKLKLISGWE